MTAASGGHRSARPVTSAAWDGARPTPLRATAWVAGALAVGLALSLTYCRTAPPTTPDSFEYMRGGQTLWSGQGFRNLSGGDQLVFPPFYPILIGGLDRVLQDPVLSGRLISLSASLLSVLLVYLLAGVFSPGRPAIIAAWLFALLPVRVMTSGMVWTESLFVALVLGGLLVWVASEQRPALGLICGLLLGAGYLTRTEGLVLFAVATAGALLGGARRAASWQRLALIVIGFAAVSSPYVVYLKSHTGRWQLSCKVDYNLAVAEGRSKQMAWESLNLLSPDDTTVSPPPRPTSLRETAIRFVQNARQELELLTNLVSPLLVACIGLGLTLAPRRRLASLAWPVMAALASPLVVLPFFFVEKRMLLLAAVLPILLAAPAYQQEERGVSPSPGMPRLAVAYVALAGALLWMMGQNAFLMTYGRAVRADALIAAVRQAGEAPGPIIGNHALAFTTGRDYLPLPWAPLDRVLRYAHHHRAAFLLVNTRDHPELASLARRPRETPVLLPVARVEYHVGDEQIIEQLYRLLPPPEGESVSRRRGREPAP